MHIYMYGKGHGTFMKKIWNLYRHSLWWMGGVFVAVMLITVGYLVRTPNTYQATTQLLTYGEMSQFPIYRSLLLENPSFKTKLNKRLILNGAITENTKVSDDTYTLSYSPANPVFTITSVSTNAANAAKIANTTANYFVEHVGHYTTETNIKIITPAQKPRVAYAPQKKRVLFLGFISALLMSFTIGTIKSLFFGKVSVDFLMDNVDGSFLGNLKIH